MDVKSTKRPEYPNRTTTDELEYKMELIATGSKHEIDLLERCIFSLFDKK